MLRRLLVIVSLLALVMAVASPALADNDKDKDNKHTPTATTTATATGTVTATASATAEKEALVGKAFQATVVTTPAADATTLVVKNAKFASNLTIKTDADTVIHWPKGIAKQTIGTTPKLSDFMAGDRVVIKLDVKPTDLTKELMARAIYLVPGQTFIHFTGDVSVAPTGGTMSVKNGSVEKKFAVDPSTPVRNGHESTTLDKAQLKVGDKVTVVARANPATGDILTAFSIAVHGQNNGKAEVDKEKKDNPGVGKGNGNKADDDQEEDQNETEEAADNGQPHGKALGHDKTNKPGKP